MRSSRPSARSESVRIAFLLSSQALGGLDEATLRRVPIDATVRDRHAVLEPGSTTGRPLTTGSEVALQHETHDRAVARPDLLDHIGEHLGLAGVVFSGL